MHEASPQPPTEQPPPQHPMRQWGGGVTHEITHGPSFAMLRVDLQPGQTVVAEAGSMVARGSHVGMEVKLNANPKAGFLSKLGALVIAFIRKVIGGETFFVNHFSAAQPGSLWIAPTLAGQITHRRLQGEAITLSRGAYVASSGDLQVNIKFGGIKSILAKEGAFFLEVSGHGELWFTSYGGIHAVDINGPFQVDNGHLVGFEGNLQYTLKSAGGGLLGFVASGEGIVCEFTGQGRVYLQSRNLWALVDWLSPMLPK